MLNYRLLICILSFLPALGGNGQTIMALTANAGANTNVCPGDSVRLGGSPTASGGTAPYTYSWQPAAYVDFAGAPNPNAFPPAPTNYTLIVTDASGATAVDIVNVSIFSPPIVSAGSDQTILQGTSTMLYASGAVNYYWTPTDPLTNQNSANPVAEPSATDTFCVQGVDGNGCSNTDCMMIIVIPSDTIIIYNAFSPNGDGINEVFYVSNIGQYPDNKLEVFSRTGKMVYQASPYNNLWNGKIDGTDLPAATYYYVFYPGNGKEKVNGSVTIIR